MAKIIVLGNSGAGKSTLTTALGQIKDIEYLHLDPLVFKYNWNEPSFKEMEEKVDEMLTKSNWIIDGN